jgi:hypothetical protein
MKGVAACSRPAVGEADRECRLVEEEWSENGEEVEKDADMVPVRGVGAWYRRTCGWRLAEEWSRGCAGSMIEGPSHPVGGDNTWG